MRGRAAGAAWVAAALAYLALGVWATWPLAGHLPDHVVDPVPAQGAFGWLTFADTLLVIWALAWDVHALGTAPLGLFDANVFHPARWALARSDHFLGNLPLYAPLYLATDNSVLAHQALLVLGFPLSALAMCVSVARWTRSLPAGFVAGLFFGLAPWRFTQLAHVQLLSTFYVPLVLLCAWAAVSKGGARAWVGLVVLTALQALCSVYLGVVAFGAGAAMIVGTWLGAPRGAWPRAAAAAGALLVAAAAVLALSWPYLALGRLGAIPRVPAAASSLGTPLELAAAHPVYTYLAPFRRGSADGYYFLGWCCSALALVGALASAPRSARGLPSPRPGLLLVLLAGWVVSLGYVQALPGGASVTLPLGWLADAFPFFRSLRAPIRLGMIVAIAAAALGGLGYARLERLLGGGKRRAALAVAVAALALLEVSGPAIPLRRVPVGGSIPPAYGWLAAQEPGPVLELPVGFLDHDFLGDVAAVRWQSTYEYVSTTHWRPLLNGYSGYPPESFYFLMAIARRLPAEEPLQDLVDLSGVRWLVVHRAALRPPEQQVWSEVKDGAGLVRRGTFGDDVVFEVTLAARRDLRKLLATDARRPETLAGLSREALPPGALRAALEDLAVPRTMLAGALHGGTVTVRNLGDRTWPGFDPVREGLVGVAYRWRRTEGDGEPGALFARLARDLAPGEAMRMPFGILAPTTPGRYELVVTLRQDGGPWFDEAGVAARVPVEVHASPARARDA